jgi:hypothetical protein
MKAIPTWMSVLALLFLAGCSTGDSSSGTTSASTAAAVPTTTAAAPKATLLEACPAVEAALPKNLLVPDAAQLAQIRAAVQAITDGADVEAVNAMQLFIDGIDAAAAAYQDSNDPMPGLTASEAFDNGLSAFAHRCKVAGSSALQ